MHRTKVPVKIHDRLLRVRHRRRSRKNGKPRPDCRLKYSCSRLARLVMHVYAVCVNVHVCDVLRLSFSTRPGYSWLGSRVDQINQYTVWTNFPVWSTKASSWSVQHELFVRGSRTEHYAWSGRLNEENKHEIKEFLRDSVVSFVEDRLDVTPVNENPVGINSYVHYCYYLAVVCSKIDASDSDLGSSLDVSTKCHNRLRFRLHNQIFFPHSVFPPPIFTYSFGVIASQEQFGLQIFKVCETFTWLHHDLFHEAWTLLVLDFISTMYYLNFTNSTSNKVKLSERKWTWTDLHCAVWSVYAVPFYADLLLAIVSLRFLCTVIVSCVHGQLQTTY